MHPSNEALAVLDYLNYRADVIENEIKTNLMNRDEAKKIYEELFLKYPETKVKVQMNKQKWDKRHPSYLVNIVNIIVENAFWYWNFNDDPMQMGLLVDDIWPIRTLCRRMDWAYPNVQSPKVIWEVKEYYGTTTFWSRVADWVYETMLVGEELNDVYRKHNMKIDHILFVDDHFTWWSLWRSYLCRLVDILNMWYVDRIFFWREVVCEWNSYLENYLELPSQ